MPLFFGFYGFVVAGQVANVIDILSKYVIFRQLIVVKKRKQTKRIAINMSVVIETTLGDITVDLFLEDRPRTCLNFLKLCKLKFYNYNLFHTIQNEFIAQTGDPSGSGQSGMSVWGVVEGPHKRFFESESMPKIRHSEPGLISMVSSGENMIGSQFFFTLGSDLLSLDEKHCVFGEVVEGMDVLRQLNEVICDNKSRPYKDVRITHTVVLNDPFENPRGFRELSRSPSPNADRLQGGRIAADEEIDDMTGKTEEEINEMLQIQEAKARATILEIVGDLPDAEIAPPENVLFICKLNPVTTDDDLEIIFSRFGKIVGCEVIRDRKSGDSLQYAFVEFENQKSCEDAYFKMDNVLIDDRRIHVDFSQSVSKIQWKGKGRGLLHLDEKNGKYKSDDKRNNRIDFNARDFKGRNPEERKGQRRSRSPRRPPIRQINKSPPRKRSWSRDRGACKNRRSRSPQRRTDPRRNNSRNDTK